MEILASRSCSAREYWENIYDLELCCSVACGHCLLADAQEMVCWPESSQYCGWIQCCWNHITESFLYFMSLVVQCGIFIKSIRDKKKCLVCFTLALAYLLAYLANQLLIWHILWRLIVRHIHFSWNSPLLKRLLMPHWHATENTSVGVIFSARLTVAEL